MLHTLHNSPFAVHPPPQQSTGLFCSQVTNMALLSGWVNVRVFLIYFYCSLVYESLFFFEQLSDVQLHNHLIRSLDGQQKMRNYFDKCGNVR